MKKMKQVRLDAFVDGHRKKLRNGALAIQIMSMFMQIVCLVGIFTDSIHTEAYCIVFTIASITALFGVLMYDRHKRDFK